MLVVDDEAIVRIGMVDELDWAGFDVHQAADAQGAVDLLSAHGNMDVLLTDVTMPPGETGLQLAALVRERWPR